MVHRLDLLDLQRYTLQEEHERARSSPSLRRIKNWHLLLVLVLIGGVILAYPIAIKFTSDLPYPSVWKIVRQSQESEAESAKRADKTAVAPELVELRKRHLLRPLSELENDTQIQNVSRGVYGFSRCGATSLSVNRDNGVLLEIHKHLDGIVYYVGYASKDDITKYIAGKKNFHILASPSSKNSNLLLFEIPIDFVSKCQVRPFKESYIFDLFVTRIPKLH